jgi:uncharacterized protein (DUF2141 family)
MIKKIIYISLILGVTILNSGDKFNLDVSVDKLRNSKGVVRFALYNKDGSIPDKNYKNYYKKNIAKIVNNSSHTIFKDLPKGRYAVSILHDEDLNGKIDKGFVLPTEGVGFSNYKSINIMNKPNFKKASFELNKDTKKKITVIYF